MSHDLNEIETATKHYADTRENLAELVESMVAQIEAIQRQQLPAIKRVVARAAQRHAQLTALIESCPHCFEKPRSLVFHGIKIGYRKGTGGITWEDDAQLINLIRKHLPDLEDLLIKTTETPIKKALGDLEVSDLKRLGVTVEDTGDQVVIKPVDGNVEKTVKALLKNATEELTEEAA